MDWPGDYNYQTIVDLPGLFVECMICGYLEIDGGKDYRECDSKEGYIMPAGAKFYAYNSLEKFCRVERNPEDQTRDRLVFFRMPPSFTAVVKTKHSLQMKEAVKFLNGLQ
jgi:hypothetical protein